MASIRREVLIDAPPAEVWDAVRDFGRLDERVMRGFVSECRLHDERTRTITFANGIRLREELLGLDEEARRFAYRIVDGPLPLEHHSGSVQVFDAGDEGALVVWISDVLPDDYAGAFADVMDQGLAVMKRTLEPAKAG